MTEQNEEIPTRCWDPVEDWLYEDDPCDFEYPDDLIDLLCD